VNAFDWGSTARAVRNNGIETRWVYGDITRIDAGARANLGTFARDVWWVDVLFGQFEARLGLSKRVCLEVLFEDMAGVDVNLEIATASSRLDALILGADGLSVPRTPASIPTSNPRAPTLATFSGTNRRCEVLTAV
jgi:citrate lyase subunit beta/citryl-CoA lyase